MTKATTIIDRINEAYIIIQKAEGERWTTMAYCNDMRAAHELTEGAFKAGKGKMHYRIVQNRDVVAMYPSKSTAAVPIVKSAFPDVRGMGDRVMKAGQQAADAYLHHVGARKPDGRNH